MDSQELERVKHEAFVQRFKNFLANDPYWVYLLTMEGGRQRRRKVAQEIAKLTTTIPRLGDNG